MNRDEFVQRALLVMAGGYKAGAVSGSSQVRAAVRGEVLSLVAMRDELLGPEGCEREEHPLISWLTDSPQDHRPTWTADEAWPIEKLIDRVKALYAYKTCGGPLHLVLDDGNCDDASVRFALQEAFRSGIESDGKDNESDGKDNESALALDIALQLWRMPEASRAAFCDVHYDEYSGVHYDEYSGD